MVNSEEWIVNCKEEAVQLSESGGCPGEANEANRSHRNEPFCSQLDTPKTTRTKPRQSTIVVSMVYGRFRPIFSQVATDEAMFYIANSGRLRAERGPGLSVSGQLLDKHFRIQRLNEMKSLFPVFSMT